MIVAWWSGGITSAVACKKALENYSGQIAIVYIETGSHHDDTLRFKDDCEKWYQRSIETIQTKKYSDHFDVLGKDRFINSPGGARCTKVLKRDVREKWEKTQYIKGYVWGFDFNKKEQGRADRIKIAIPKYDHYFPLLDDKITKQDCFEIIKKQNIEIPTMYKLGFHNNNCIGCVKGGMGYWNLIRKHFPDVFLKMSQTEREVGRSCLRSHFLDELPEDAGRNQPPLVQDCGSTGEGCLTQLSHEYYARD
jgi:hypothetical protein